MPLSSWLLRIALMFNCFLLSFSFKLDPIHCFSCISKEYGDYFEVLQLNRWLKKPNIISAQCARPKYFLKSSNIHLRNAISQPCTGYCITIIEEYMIGGVHPKEVYIRGCVNELLKKEVMKRVLIDYRLVNYPFYRKESTQQRVLPLKEFYPGRVIWKESPQNLTVQTCHDNWCNWRENLVKYKRACNSRYYYCAGSYLRTQWIFYLFACLSVYWRQWLV